MTANDALLNLIAELQLAKMSLEAEVQRLTEDIQERERGPSGMRDPEREFHE